MDSDGSAPHLRPASRLWSTRGRGEGASAGRIRRKCGGAGGELHVPTGLRTSRLQASTGQRPSWRCACSPSSWSSSSRTCASSSGAPPSLVSVLPAGPPLSVGGVPSEPQRVPTIAWSRLPAKTDPQRETVPTATGGGPGGAGAPRAALYRPQPRTQADCLVAVLAVKGSDCLWSHPSTKASALGLPGPLSLKTHSSFCRLAIGEWAGA